MPEHLSMGTVWLTLDLAGTAVFAISGAAIGVKYRLDVFGVCVLAFVAGNAGGMLRDVMLGATPPAALSGWHHVTVSLLAALLTFWWHPRLERLRTPILLFDAAGLGLFAVSGTEKALAFGLDPLVAAILGMLTGIGGGVLRDLLVNEIPTVLHGRAVRRGRARRRSSGRRGAPASPSAGRADDDRWRGALFRYSARIDTARLVTSHGRTHRASSSEATMSCYMAAMVAELDRTFVPALEAAAGAAPEWFKPEG